MRNENHFFGKPFDYWLELERQAKNLNATKLLDELAYMRARVSFYEERIDDMSKFKAHLDGKS